MTKSFSALMAMIVCVGFAQATTAQLFPTLDAPGATESVERPSSVFTQGLDGPMPGWAYDPDRRVAELDPVVMNRSLDIAISLGVLGQVVRPYHVSHPGPGLMAVIPGPVPEGWIVTLRCMERSEPTSSYPEGECHVYEMRELLGNPHSIAWD